MCYKCKWHHLELKIKTKQHSQQLLVSWANLSWQSPMIPFLNSLHHKRYQEQDAENILYCFILPLNPGREGACIKSTFHRLICSCALSGSWVLQSYMASSSFTCHLVEGTDGTRFHFQTENALCLFLFIPSPPHCFLWGSPTAAALLHNLTSSMQTPEGHLRAALLLYPLWPQHSLKFLWTVFWLTSSFLNKIFYSKRKMDILVLSLLLKRSLRNVFYKTALLLLYRVKV